MMNRCAVDGRGLRAGPAWSRRQAFSARASARDCRWYALPSRRPRTRGNERWRAGSSVAAIGTRIGVTTRQSHHCGSAHATPPFRQKGKPSSPCAQAGVIAPASVAATELIRISRLLHVSQLVRQHAFQLLVGRQTQDVLGSPRPTHAADCVPVAKAFGDPVGTTKIFGIGSHPSRSAAPPRRRPAATVRGSQAARGTFSAILSLKK